MGSLQHTNHVQFDGVCNLCNGFVQFLIWQDKKQILSFGALQHEDPHPERANYTTVIYTRFGQSYTQSSAVLKILGDLGGIWNLTRIFWIIPRPIRDWIYEVISRNRYRWFGKQETCLLPKSLIEPNPHHKQDGKQQ